MIRPLRRRHRRLVLGVAVIVPPLFVAARDGRTFEGRWRAAEGLVWTVLSEAG